MTYADHAFKRIAKNLITNGYVNSKELATPVSMEEAPPLTSEILGYSETYNLAKEFPLITIMPDAFHSCVEDVLYIWQSKAGVAYNNNILHKNLADEYFAQVHRTEMFNGHLVSQINRTIWQLKNTPESKNIAITFDVNYSKSTELYPLIRDIVFSVQDGRLNAVVSQRSFNVYTSANWELVQFAILVHLLAHSANLKVGKLVHNADRCFIYCDQIPVIKEAIKERPKAGPVFTLAKCTSREFDKIHGEQVNLVYQVRPKHSK